ncbi:hypothetical protein [Oceanobacillus damuensis]|uniref:hypothetical protein n=1 Tax=Oceanobacillus damuensis TaxID=937928 RepID=UPI000AA4B88C
MLNMFGLLDFLKLTMSIFIILPIVSLIREMGYLVAGKLFGVKEATITIGSGPYFFKFWIFEVRRFYFMYSWCHYESLERDSKFAHIIIYASPILANLFVALFINGLLANDLLEYETFWNQFVFYAFYFLLFDAIPLYYPDGQPSNGRVVYDLIRYGKRSDFRRNDPQINAQSEEEEGEKE